MFDNYFFLTRIAKELNKQLNNFTFFKSVSQSRNELVTGFFTSSEEKFLIFTFDKLPPFIYLKGDFAFAKKNYVEFFAQLKNQKLLEIKIDKFERNIRLVFTGYELVYLFRGHHSNVILIDEDETILESFKKPDELNNKNFSEIFPASNLDLSYFNDELKFNSLFTNGNSEQKRYLKIIGTLLIDEIKYRSEKFSRNYFQSFEQILSEISNNPLRIYNKAIPSFCELYSLNGNQEISENLFEDLIKTYFSIQKNEDISRLKERILKKLKSDYEHHFKKLQDLKNPENFIDRSEELRNFGNLILINAHSIKKGDKFFKTEFNGKEYRIKLDPSKSPYQNAEEYFEKAREEESRLSALNKIIKKEENELEEIKEALDEIENSTDIKQLLKFMNEQNQKSKQDELTKNFRHFVIDGKYDVYVGKNSKANDILTTQFAKPEDLWFHARGVSGSHVIIRRTNKKESIPKSIIEQVASIAAYYSKAKNSKLVPVAYTEKKYVIKRKGMPPGTVQLQKEKVIMVEPKIPETTLEENDE